MLPNLLAFTASFAVMVVELVGGRVLAAYVGQSLYTWTSVIGVVLGGITVGNLIGGRLADRYDTRSLLSGLFLLAATCCLMVPVVNARVGTAAFLTNVESWPLRIALHVTLVFFLPAAALGTIGPVVAKMALDRGTLPGRTVGNVYAWGALGSIVGTFATGFFLIAMFGTAAIVCAIAALLAIVGFALWPRFAWPMALMVAAGFWVIFARGPLEARWRDGRLSIRAPCDDCLYETESQYSYIKVQKRDDDSRELVLDNLIHAYYVPADHTELRYDYEKVYGAITTRFRPIGAMHTLFIGGGGYVFPRYLRARWPETRIQVAEIDPAVTAADLDAFGLLPSEVRLRPSVLQAAPPPATANAIDVFHLDARNHVEDLVRAKAARTVEPFDFDFIYGDAFNDFAVPFHLVTREFIEKIHALLRPDTGIYMINVIDIFNSGRFLGALVRTMQQVFPYVAVFAGKDGGAETDRDQRETFVVVGALRELDVVQLGGQPGEPTINDRLLSADEMRTLDDRSRGLTLTDDYAPVENLLTTVVRRGR